MHRQQMVPSCDSSPLVAHRGMSCVMRAYKIARVSAPFADILLPADGFQKHRDASGHHADMIKT